jgi:integrase/recombinase XerD
MNAFADWLVAGGLARSTAAGYARRAAALESWLEGRGLTAAQASYADLVAWLGSLSHLSAKTRAGHLAAARRYLGWLTHTGERADNPAEPLTVRGVRRRLAHGLLEARELSALYSGWPGETACQVRDRAMLGLVLFQALRAGELKRLALGDVDAEAGTVSVAGSRLGAGRVLWLEARQLAGLRAYLDQARPALVSRRGADSDRLFVSAGGGASLANVLARLRRELPCRLETLRASRLALWLKSEHVREVQRRAGHRQVSTTERYQAQQQDRLRAAVARHHPLSGGELG